MIQQTLNLKQWNTQRRTVIWQQVEVQGSTKDSWWLESQKRETPWTSWKVYSRRKKISFRWRSKKNYERRTMLEWISERRVNGFRVSCKPIRAKARKMLNESQSVDTDTKVLVFSDGWVQKFLNRNGLSDQLVDRLCVYILKVRLLRKKME